MVLPEARFGPPPPRRIEGVQEGAYNVAHSDLLHGAATDVDAFADALGGEFLPALFHTLADIRQAERKDFARADDMREQRMKWIGSVRALQAIYVATSRDEPQNANDLAIGTALRELIHQAADIVGERAAEKAIPGDD